MWPFSPPIRDKVVLVLPHTFFHNAFRCYMGGGYSLHDWTTLVRCRFIASFIIEKQLEEQTDFFAAASENAVKAFLQDFDDYAPAIGAENVLPLFRSALELECDPDIEKLGDYGSTIAIANKKSQSSEVTPVVIVNSNGRANFVQETIKFYKQPYGQFRQEDIPFKIMDAIEVTNMLDKKYPDAVKTVKNSLPEVFKF